MGSHPVATKTQCRHRKELEDSNTYLQRVVITYKSSAKFPDDFFAVVHKLILKLTWKCEEPRLAKQQKHRKEIQRDGRTFPKCKTY